MSDSVLLRLFWKEYRVQRNFWISVAVVALLGQLLVLGLPKQYLNRPDWLFGLALACPALFALGCGASLFAGEREDGTFEQLRILAAPPDRVLMSKLGFSVVSTVGLLGLLWLLAFNLAGRELPSGNRQLWSIFGVACVESFAWGLFFSLITKRPLNAAVLAAVAISLSIPLIRMISLPWEEMHKGRSSIEWHMEFLSAQFITARIVLAIFVLATDVIIALRWVLERPQIIRRAVGLTRVEAPRLGGPIGRLVWQECRQAARTIAVLLAVTLLLIVFFRNVTGGPRGIDAGFALSVIGVMSAITGACVFLAEQEGKQFRFFADHGVAPRQVWWSKQLVWFTANVVAFLMIGFYVAYSVQPEIPWTDYFRNPLERTFFVLLMPVIGYCSGQLASILIPRGLVAGFFSILLTFLIALWMGLMMWIGIGLLWSVAPILLIFLIATRTRVEDWLLERNTWRAWCRFTAVLGLPLVALFAGVAGYRVFEIPATGPGFSPEEFLRLVSREETETAELYRGMIAMMTPMRGADPSKQPARDPDFAKESWDHATEQERDWLNANHQTVERTLDASRRAACVFRDPKSMRFDDVLSAEGETRQLAWLLALDARRLESEGQLDEALERYLATMRMARHVANRGTYIPWLIGSAIESVVCERMPLWAAHADQTPERIRKALGELEIISKDFPPASDAVKAEYIMLRRLLDSDPADVAAATGGVEGEVALVLWGRLMPWELTRARRLHNVITAWDLATVESVERELAAGRWEFLTKEPFYGGGASAQFAGYGPQVITTPFIRLLYPATNTIIQAPVRRETQLRALRIILALKGWQGEHGELPDTLDELVSEYFDRLPPDPFTGQSFGYRPGGFPAPVRFAAPQQFESEPGKPILWSAGFERAQLVQDGAYENGIPHYRMLGQQRNSFGYAPAGWAFPIP